MSVAEDTEVNQVDMTIGHPEELPKRQPIMPDWSSLQTAQRWRFRPVPVQVRQQQPSLLPVCDTWSADVDVLERVLRWMRARDWGDYRSA